jgi:hypothetical protein
VIAEGFDILIRIFPVRFLGCSHHHHWERV